VLFTVNSRHARLLSTVNGNTTSGSSSLCHPRKKSKIYIYIWVLYKTPNTSPTWNNRGIFMNAPKLEGEPRSHYMVMGFAKACSKVWSKSVSTNAPSTKCMLWLSCGWTSSELLSSFTLVIHFVRSRWCPYVGR